MGSTNSRTLAIKSFMFRSPFETPDKSTIHYTHYVFAKYATNQKTKKRDDARKCDFKTQNA